MASLIKTAVGSLQMNHEVVLAEHLAVSANYDQTTSKIVTETDLSNAIAGLGQALSYAGVADQNPATSSVTTVNGGTAVTIKAGNVVSYENKEYLCVSAEGTQTWKEFGDEGAFVVKNESITAVTEATLLKVKYDSKGLVTGSEAATKADIPGMVDKVETSTTIAGLALTGNIGAADLKSALDVSKVEASETNGNIKVDGAEVTVFTLPEDVVQDAEYKHITVTATSISDGTTTASIPQGALASKSAVSESDLDAELAAKVNASAEGNHSHANKELLDTYTQTEADLADAVAKKHTHADTAVDILADVKAGYDSSKASYDAVKTAVDALQKLDIANNPTVTVSDIANKVDAIITALATSVA